MKVNNVKQNKNTTDEHGQIQTRVQMAGLLIEWKTNRKNVIHRRIKIVQFYRIYREKTCSPTCRTAEL